MEQMMGTMPNMNPTPAPMMPKKKSHLRIIILVVLLALVLIVVFFANQKPGQLTEQQIQNNLDELSKSTLNISPEEKQAIIDDFAATNPKTPLTEEEKLRILNSISQ